MRLNSCWRASASWPSTNAFAGPAAASAALVVFELPVLLLAPLAEAARRDTRLVTFGLLLLHTPAVAASLTRQARRLDADDNSMPRLLLVWDRQLLRVCAHKLGYECAFTIEEQCA